MAERRMFAKTIVLSDDFLDMPMSARCLYFTLGMFADDDGFVNSPKGIMRQCGSSQDDMNILISKRYILLFESGVIVVRHWRINNFLRSDRYQQTKNVEEKKLLDVTENGAYEFGIPNSGIPRLDKVSLNQISINKIKEEEVIVPPAPAPKYDLQNIVNNWNSLSEYGIKQIQKISSGTKRYDSIIARLNEYSEEDVLTAIDKIRTSEFLQGHNKRGWVIFFDWFVLPNNFPKVLEGNYDSVPKAKAQEGRLNWIDDINI